MQALELESVGSNSRPLTVGRIPSSSVLWLLHCKVGRIVSVFRGLSGELKKLIYVKCLDSWHIVPLSRCSQGPCFSIRKIERWTG